MYEVWQKSDETDFLFTKVFIFSNINVHPLQNRSFGQPHTDGDVVPKFSGSAGGLQPVWYSACPLYSCGYSLKSFEEIFKIRKKENVTGAEFG